MDNPSSDIDGMTTLVVEARMNRHQPLELPSHEVLAQLARDDPQAYESLRSEVIESFIDSAPERLKPRLNGIQFHVDGIRRLSRSSALGATVRVYQLMWKSFLQMNQVWQDFIPIENNGPNRARSKQPTKRGPLTSAQILQFRPRTLYKHCSESQACRFQRSPEDLALIDGGYSQVGSGRLHPHGVSNK